MKQLPIAKTDLRKIVEGNFCYVDKTKFVKDLVDDNHEYYFLSRPRRFGKSLFIDTLRAAFAGEKELFKDLYLENNWDWSVKYPVITISFGGGTVTNTDELNNHIKFLLENNASNYGIVIQDNFIPDIFKRLIIKLFEKFNLPVVILIDEYDKPILDNITKDTVEIIRESLSSFYSVLKDSSKYIKFVFLTGVSRFSKTSIFSKLNNLTDITLNDKYADICGITQNDLETVFADYLKDVNLTEVKQWYDGYNFRGSNLYNPYDVLMFLWEKRYKSYWFQTGTPTFLLELIKTRKFYIPTLDSIKIFESQLEEFDVNNIDLEVLLFQTEYLTIKRQYEFNDNQIYELHIPNKEVKKGITDYLLRMLYASAITANERTLISEKIYYAVVQNNPRDLELTFKAFFSSIPPDWYRKNDIAHYEGFYCSIIYTFFAALGFTVIPEDVTNEGKIDLTIISNTCIFIIEFKMNTNPKNALQQIKDMKYYQKYSIENKPVFMVGIEFDEEQKNISLFEWEKLVN